ncbi:unnamed protein product [Cuscuta campestris]|uniref:GIY-YIG domain-containing protein n=1 Tax=Cuscuta campestris TaxID=132261 RepID=A0A484MG71_9ASTE|nr:unnamed protein product [Cuscuta campestris]
MQRQRSSVLQQFQVLPPNQIHAPQSSLAHLTMAASSAAAVDRLNREDCKRTKHDSAFSEWKILVGPNDWQDYVSGIEGAERYRTQNLPNCASCPGIYELGITPSNPRRETANHRVDSAIVVPVYVGQTDNVRTRLQQYGRDGSHLENGCSKGDLSWDKNALCSKGPLFFTCAFSRGLTVVYRWAPMKSKKDAEKAEAQLLDKFDYAWNTDRHGSVCIRSPAKGRKRCCEHKGMKINGSLNSKLIADDGSSNETLICGFVLENGSPCASKPFGKNKRCIEHKGRRIHGVKKSLTKHNDYLHISGEDSSKNQSDTQKENPLKTSDERSNSIRICGATLKNGSSCRRKLAEGNTNTRCWQHSGSIN